MNSSFLVAIAAAIWLRLVLAEPQHSNGNPIPRPTLAPNYGKYGAAPTTTLAPGNNLNLRAEALAPRALRINTCGIVTLPWTTFPLACEYPQPCQTDNGFMKCDNIVGRTCYDGTATECRSRIDLNTRCCTSSDDKWLPTCVTYYKELDRDNWVSLLECQWKAHSGRTSLDFVPASIEDNFLRGTQTALGSPDSTMTLTSSTSASASAPASPSPASSSSNIPTIVGGAVGGLVAVVIGACVVVWLLIREKRASRTRDALSPSQNPSQSAQFSNLPEVSVPANHLPLYCGAEERHKYQSVSAASPSGPSEARLASSPSPRHTINVNDSPVELE
ncbi:hypothetical protein JMJ77_0002396 [Colletotrichum scovillei]|uniref:Uncharacterized protein n=1 Tax=Colletotrichum scovillei TaxID=1209932 RepID=A0A9P7R8V5_9PEZI|nr:hypothetical protein JMJ77_0002396 [Colletotrichum scovillei]KAG7070815.1 hypothetical protein JMJ76_0002060 [Colletotrichum scovillei]KAG7079085.1 hypothetical protein JMJ78_0002746 [Colletotrichum scovillei]